MSTIKEPGFFAYGGELPAFRCPRSADVLSTLVCDEREYKQLFSLCPAGHKAGEATPFYLAHPDAPARAASFVPHAKLVAVLRNPVDRAFSHWVYYRMKGIEGLDSLEKGMEKEAERMGKGWRLGWAYRYLGCYGQHLERWLKFYPRENLLVVFHEDLVEDPHGTLNRIFAHIGVQEMGIPHIPSRNRSFAPRSARLQRWIMGDNRFRRLARRFLPVWMRDVIMWPMLALNLGKKPLLNADLKRRLSAEFESEIRRVEELTGHNLDAWRGVSRQSPARP